MKEEDRRRAIQRKLAGMDERPAASVPTGEKKLDDLLGGGWPRGRMVEIFGPPACGKTTLLLRSAAHAQTLGFTVAWIDADRTFDASFAEELRVDVRAMPVLQPESAEEAAEIALRLTLSRAVDLIVVDSAAALVPRLELDAGIGDNSPGLHSRVLASGLRKIAAAAARAGTAVVFSNHARGDDGEGSAGGPPLKLHAAARIALEPAGRRIRLRVVKSRLAGSSRECLLPAIAGNDSTEGP